MTAALIGILSLIVLLCPALSTAQIATRRARFHQRWNDCCSADGHAMTVARWVVATVYSGLANASLALLLVALLFAGQLHADIPFPYGLVAGLLSAYRLIEGPTWFLILLGPLMFAPRRGAAAIEARWHLLCRHEGPDDRQAVPSSRTWNSMMKQFIVWTLAALIFLAAYAVYFFYFDAKADCTKQQVASTSFCAAAGS